MRKFLFLISLGVACFTSRAGSFTVADPLLWNSTITGTFDTVKTFVTLHGAYARYDVELVISAHEHTSVDTAKLEVVCSMALPEDASVIDASLLIEGKWVKAELMERGLATSTYESVVTRRRDPLLFVKESDTQYDFKIYPMYRTSSRSMRFSYTLPLGFSDSTVSILVDNQFKLLSAARPNANILIVADTSIARLTNNEGIPVSEGAGTFTCDLNSVTSSSLYFNAIVKETNGLILTTGTYKKEKYYNLSVSPEILYKNKLLSNKYVFVLDYDSKARNYIYGEYDTELTTGTNYDGTTYSYHKYLTKDSAISYGVYTTGVKHLLLNTLKDADSVCFLFPDANGNLKRTGYIRATKPNIENVFNSEVVATCDYSLLFPGLYSLTKESNSLSSHVVVIANNTTYTNSYSNYEVASSGAALAKKLDSLSGRDLKMIIFSLESPNGAATASTSTFFTTMSTLSKGSIVKCKTVADLSSASNISLILESLYDNILSISVNIKANNGVLYNQFSNIDEVLGKDKPCILTGKFNKADSFTLDLVIESVDSVYVQEYQINNVAIRSDTMIYTGWAIQQLNYLEDELFIEKQQMINDYYNSSYYYYYNLNYSAEYLQLRQDVITASIAHSVLSTETAFLSLEPSMVVEGCKDCANTTELNLSRYYWATDGVETEEEPNATAYPNPFNKRITISIPSSIVANQVQLIQIVNVSGQVVKEIPLEGDSCEWDGSDNDGNDVPGGIYYVVITSETAVKTILVSKM